MRVNETTSQEPPGLIFYSRGGGVGPEGSSLFPPPSIGPYLPPRNSPGFQEKRVVLALDRHPHFAQGEMRGTSPSGELFGGFRGIDENDA